MRNHYEITEALLDLLRHLAYDINCLDDDEMNLLDELSEEYDICVKQKIEEKLEKEKKREAAKQAKIAKIMQDKK